MVNYSNNTINNFQILTLGRENLNEFLDLDNKKAIMKSRYSCLERVVYITHCGEYNQFKNIIITNLKDDYAYKYDDRTRSFICVDKNKIMTELIDERLENIREINDLFVHLTT